MLRDGVAIPSKPTSDIGGPNRSIVPKRELYAKCVVDVVRITHPKLDQRRRREIDDDEIGLVS